MTTLSTKTVEWAIQHFTHHNDTDIFPKAFEFEAISHCRDEVIKWLSKQDICQWQTRAFRRCLVPKHRYGFRLATQLDPLDMLFFSTLILETGELIEKSRLPSNQNIVFSHRFAPHDDDFLLFDRNIGYPKFQEHCGALAKNYGFVVVTDIADFYPRIYLHRLENALSSATGSLPTHAKAIIQLVKGWNQNVSYGIPIGSDPSRLLAELVIDDVDRTLLAEGVVFTRFNDDFRIFCNSRQEAYQCLAHLANILYDSHGLTLQSQKTKILSTDEFINEVLDTEEQKELRALFEGFEEIAAQLGIADPYEPIIYFDLPQSIQEKIDVLNLDGLLDKQLENEEIDIPMTKFLINRMGQLRRVDPLQKILGEIDKLYPVLPEVIRYLAAVGNNLSHEDRREIGAFLLGKLKDSVISPLEFNRMAIMSLFAGSHEWGNADKLARYYNDDSNIWFRRTLHLALGRAGQSYWLRTKKTAMEQMPEWERRAFIYAASCFPRDERENWYRAIGKSRQDNLEKYIISWAPTNLINA